MEILCWNLGFASGRRREEPGLHDRAWHWIAAVDPDLAFLQEVEPPSWALERWEIDVLPHHFWASAVLARHGSGLAPVELPAGGVIGAAKGYQATAEILLADGIPLLVASVHTPARSSRRRAQTRSTRSAWWARAWRWTALRRSTRPDAPSRRNRPIHLEPVWRLIPAASAAFEIVQPDRTRSARSRRPSGVRRAPP
jgi:hypothetical protein